MTLIISYFRECLDPAKKILLRTLFFVFLIFLSNIIVASHFSGGLPGRMPAPWNPEVEPNVLKNADENLISQGKKSHGTENIPEDEKFNAGKFIIDHISDSHEWHILEWNGYPVSVPLPIILYHKDRGFAMFLSKKFEHGCKIVQGYKLDHNHILAVDENGVINEEATAKIWDFSITKNAVSMFFSILIMLWLFISIANTYKRNKIKSPTGVQSFLEPIIIFVRDEIAISSIGKKNYLKYMPFLLTIFFFIWINNLLGIIPIIPGGANLTGNIAITMTLAVFTFLITTFSANKHYWRHIFAMPGIPIFVLPLIIVIEIMGMFLKPFVLMIRLFANILAGHIITMSFFSLIFIFGAMHIGAGYGVSVLSIAFTVFIAFLELLVGFIQAYIFALLSALYFGMATQESH
ncbi:MAG: F0F1 ATP synthase subunit A [Bacteroidota bacterium]